jgi:hypothetical protein
VYTPYSTGIIYEYAYKALREGEPVDEKSISKLRSDLLSTGLFADVAITSSPRGNSGTVDIRIEPKWSGQPRDFILNDILLNNFVGIDDQKIRQILARNGIGSGSRLMDCPPQEVKNQLFDAIEEVYKDNPDALDEFDRRVNFSSIKVVQTKAEHFNLVVTACDPVHKMT